MEEQSDTWTGHQAGLLVNMPDPSGSGVAAGRTGSAQDEKAKVSWVYPGLPSFLYAP